MDFYGFFGYNTKKGAFLQEQNFPVVFRIMNARPTQIRWFFLVFGLIFCLGETILAEDWFALLDSNSCQRRNRAWYALSLEAQETSNPAVFLRTVQNELQKSSLSFISVVVSCR